MAYLPPEQAVEGSDALAVEYMNERFPVTVAVVGATRALRSRECEDPLVKVLVCVKRVPMTGGRIVLTDDALAIETKHLGFAISPHEECGVEEAVRLVEQHGGESVVLTLGPADAEEQLRDAMAIGIDRGHPPRHRRRGVGSRGDRRRDRRGDPRRRGRLGAVRPHLLRQRVGRLGRLPGRPSRRLRARPPLRDRAQERRRRGRDRAVRAGDRRRPRRLRAAAARRRDRARRAQPAALPVRAGPDARGTQAARGDDARRGPRRGSSCRGSSSRRARRGRPRCSATAPEAAAAVVDLLRADRGGVVNLVLVEHADGVATDVSLQALALAADARRRDARAADRARWRRGGGAACPGRRRARRRARRRSTRSRPTPGRRSSAGVAERIGATAVVAPGHRARRPTRWPARPSASASRSPPTCTAVTPGTPLSLTRIRWGGSLLEEARAARRAGAADRRAAHGRRGCGRARPGSVETFTPELAEADLVVRVRDRVAPPAGGVSLADAKVVVTGGRGVGSAEGFAAIEELAALLGGAVGCSRAVTMSGWRPHTDQVGQTGNKIAPEIYIACGVSGRDAAHRRRQGREADPRRQHRPRGADHVGRRLRGRRRPARGAARGVGGAAEAAGVKPATG